LELEVISLDNLLIATFDVLTFPSTLSSKLFGVAL